MKLILALATVALAACEPVPTGPPSPFNPDMAAMPVVATQDTFGGLFPDDLQSAFSYTEQGDTAALEDLLAEPYPSAIAIAAGETWVAESCYTRSCELVYIRRTGRDEKFVAKAEHLAVDGR